MAYVQLSLNALVPLENVVDHRIRRGVYQVRYELENKKAEYQQNKGSKVAKVRKDVFIRKGQQSAVGKYRKVAHNIEVNDEWPDRSCRLRNRPFSQPNELEFINEKFEDVHAKCHHKHYRERTPKISENGELKRQLGILPDSAVNLVDRVGFFSNF